jgi:type II secretory pathway component PulL
MESMLVALRNTSHNRWTLTRYVALAIYIFLVFMSGIDVVGYHWGAGGRV